LKPPRNEPKIRGELNALAVVVLMLCLACGKVPAVGEIPAANTASASRTASPLASPSVTATTVPDAKLLSARGCSSTTFDTTPLALGNYTIRLAPGWTDTKNNGTTESRMLELKAPANYGHSPTLINFHVWGAGGVQRATAHEIASEMATSRAGNRSAQSVAGLPEDCSVASESAAVYGYTDGSEVGYRFWFVHKRLLYAVWLSGTGGIGDQAIQDALGMMSSIVWTM
jgi:hypothetical protein